MPLPKVGAKIRFIDQIIGMVNRFFFPPYDVVLSDITYMTNKEFPRRINFRRDMAEYVFMTKGDPLVVTSIVDGCFPQINYNFCWHPAWIEEIKSSGGCPLCGWPGQPTFSSFSCSNPDCRNGG